MIKNELNHTAMWIAHCKALADIYESASIPCRMIALGWPGSKDPWSDGKDLLWIDHIFHLSDDLEVETRLDPGYTQVPIPIQALPLLLVMAKDHFRDAKYADDPNRRKGGFTPIYVAPENYDKLVESVPIAMMWNDWDEDDDLDIHCVSQKIWDEVMTFKKPILENLISRWCNEFNQPKMYVARCTSAGIAYELVSDVPELVNTVRELTKDSKLVPLVVQTAEDGYELAELIFWLMDPDILYTEESEDDD